MPYQTSSRIEKGKSYFILPSMLSFRMSSQPLGAHPLSGPVEENSLSGDEFHTNIKIPFCPKVKKD
jgi:hypothetical protein